MKRETILENIRFVKRLTNLPELQIALQNHEKCDHIIAKIINHVMEIGIFRKLIKCLEYGLEKKEKRIFIETLKAIDNIQQYGNAYLK